MVRLLTCSELIFSVHELMMIFIKDATFDFFPNH